MKQKTLQQLEEQCAAWNKAHPVGTAVHVRFDDDSSLASVTESEAWLCQCGSKADAVIATGFGGVTLLDRVTAMEEEPEDLASVGIGWHVPGHHVLVSLALLACLLQSSCTVNAAAWMEDSQQAHAWLAAAPHWLMMVAAFGGFLVLFVAMRLAWIVGREVERRVWEAEWISQAEQRREHEEAMTHRALKAVAPPAPDPLVAYAPVRGEPVIIKASLARRLSNLRGGISDL
jgi:hypothetical protein